MTEKSRIIKDTVMREMNMPAGSGDTHPNGFRVFMKAMSDYLEKYPDEDGKITAVNVIKDGLSKMYRNGYSETDMILDVAKGEAEKLGIHDFGKAVNDNSEEERMRYMESHIKRKFIRSGTRGWPLTIEADETGWCIDYGMGECHCERRTGKTAKENFEEAYEHAGGNDGRLMTDAEWNMSEAGRREKRILNGMFGK